MPIEVVVDDVPYTVDEEMMPYFKALSSRTSTQANSPATVEPIVCRTIPLFAVAHRVVHKGLPTVFADPDMGVSVGKYKTLCDTLDLLKVDVMQGFPIEGLMQVIKWDTNDECAYSAIGYAFGLVYAMLQKRYDVKNHQIKNKIYDSVLHIISNSSTFNLEVRQVVEAVYLARMTPSQKQRAQLDKFRGKSFGWNDDFDDGAYYPEPDEPDWTRGCD